MKHGIRQRKEKQSQIAKERVELLLQQAEKSLSKEPEQSRKYVMLLKRIMERTNLRLPSIKKRFCKHCYTLLIPGKTVRVRAKRGKLSYTCLHCGKSARLSYSKKGKS